MFSPLFNTAQHTDRESQFQLVKVLIRTFDHLSTPNIAKLDNNGMQKSDRLSNQLFARNHHLVTIERLLRALHSVP